MFSESLVESTPLAALATVGTANVSNSPFYEQTQVLVGETSSSLLANELLTTAAPSSVWDEGTLLVASLLPPSQIGTFVVEDSGQIDVDFLFDSSSRRGELGLYSLTGMDALSLGSTEYKQEAARRALSNSTQGHILISDRDEGARFTGELEGRDYNRGEHPGVRSVTMTPGEEIGFIFVPRGRLLNIFERPDRKTREVFFSIADANPEGRTQLAEVQPGLFAWEDRELSRSSESSDFNDVIFSTKGLTGSATPLDAIINPEEEWRQIPLAQTIIDFATEGGSEVDTEAPVVSAFLLNDSGRNTTDRITNEPQITGSVTDQSVIESVRAGFSPAPVEEWQDIVGSLDSSGGFTLNDSKIAALNGGTPLSEGDHTFNLVATDSAGNVSETFQNSFTLDTAPPEIELSLPIEDTPLTQGSRLQGVATDATTTVQFINYRFDTQSETTPFAINDSGVFDTELNLDGIEPGEHSLAVTALDSAGNKTVEFYQVKVAQDSTDIFQTINVLPGQKIDIELADILPNGEGTQFTLLSDTPLPTGGIDGSGTLRFTPTPQEIGIYSFSVLNATTGESYTFRLEVLADALTTTRISGVIQNVEQMPLSEIKVSIGSVSTQTDGQGAFTLEFAGELPTDFLEIDPDQSGGGVVYPFIAEKLPLVLEHEVYVGFNNVIERPIYLPAIDTQNAVTIDPTQDTTVTTAAIPGAAVLVRANSLQNQAGEPYIGALSITEVPRELTPAALPNNLLPDMVVTIQPGEMSFQTPAPLSLPNTGGFAPGEEMVLWSINPATGDFDNVGVGRVSGDGLTVTTVQGGIRSSSWHFFTPPVPELEDPEENDRNKDDGCSCTCEATAAFSSMAELHSGAVTETHSLVSYQSLGVERGVTLVYDSLRADARPIVHFGFSDVTPDESRRLVAELSVSKDGFKYQVPGFEGGLGLDGGEHFWSLPASEGEVDIDAALQADLRSLQSGKYSYTLTSGILELNDNTFTGSTTDATGDLVHVNTLRSAFGSGWGIAGMQTLIENSDGSVLLIDGDGSEILFSPSDTDGSSVYVSPPGDFSELEKLTNGTFRRTMKDQTVYSFDAQNRLISIRDRHGNETQHVYENGRLSKIVDPVGLETLFLYASGRLQQITDPAGRKTRFEHNVDGDLIKVIDPDNTERVWEYKEHRMVAEVDKRGNREQAFYDFAGRADTSLLKDGSTTDINPVQVQGLFRAEETIDPFNAPIAAQLSDIATATYTDANRNTHQIVLSQTGASVSNSDAIGSLGSVERNDENLITSKIDGRGFTSFFAYDEMGNVIQSQDDISGDNQPVLLKVPSGGGLTQALFSELNPVSGETTPFFFNSGSPFIYSTSYTPSGDLLAFGRADGGKSYLFEINKEKAEATQIISIDTFDVNDVVSDFAMTSDSQMYFLAREQERQGNTGIYSFNIETEELQFLGLISDDSVFMQVLAFEFDPTTDKLFSILKYPNQEMKLYSISKNGVVTEIGDVDTQVQEPNDSLFSESVTALSINLQGELLAYTATGKEFSLNKRTGEASFNRNIEKDDRGFLISDVATPYTGPNRYKYETRFNQLTEYTDELGRKVLFDIDERNGNILSTTRVVGEIGGDDDIKTSFTYTSKGLTDLVTDPLGRITDYEYNEFGHLTSVTFAKGTANEAIQRFEYDAIGNQTASIDENGNRTIYEYDALNRLTRIIEADPDGTGALTSPVTTFAYDENGNLRSNTDSEGNTVNNTYDTLDRLINTTDSLGQTSRFSYDSLGNLLLVTDPLGNTTQNLYDERSRLIETIDAEQNRTLLSYDLNNNVTSVSETIAPGIAASRFFTTFEYDARNRVIRETDQRGQAISYVYDAVDNLIAKTDRNGRRTEYLYDDVNRLINEKWFGDSQAITYSYDKANNLLTIQDSFSNLNYSYDERDRIQSVSNIGTPNLPTVSLTYTYDGVGNMLTMRDTINGNLGGIQAYSYDALNRLTQLTQSGTSIQQKRVNFAYDSLGQFTSINRYSDLTGSQLVTETRYEYDELNRLASITHGREAEITAFYDYTYDAASRIESIEDIDGSTTFTYDDRDQLIAADRPTTPDETYAYDANGNRTSSSLHNDGYVVEAGNRLTSDGTYTYAYDNEGNMISRTDIALGDVRTFVWDYRNRIVAVIDGDSTSGETQRVEYSYDAFNRRISKTINGSRTTQFIYNGADVLLDFVDEDGPNGGENPILEQRYLHGLGVDQVLAQEGDEVLWHLTDHLGSVRDLVSNNGALQNHLTYDSFGNIVNESNPEADSRYLYTGREFDEKTGLQYNRARYFDSQIGRFISEDPIGLIGGSNLYQYALNNPVYFVDSSGNAPNQAGATNPSYVEDWLKKTPDLGSLSNSHVENINRYFYTKNHGWIDIRHFAAFADWSQPFFSVPIPYTGYSLQAHIREWPLQTSGYIIECLQYGILDWTSQKSGFSPEDLPSNNAGISFGHSIKSGQSLSDAFRIWAEKNEALKIDNPRSGFKDLPRTDPSENKFERYPIVLP